MERLLLFGGTSETAPIATALAEAGFAVLVSTATEVALTVGDHPAIERRSGALDAEACTALVRERAIVGFVVASHPFARAVREMARRVAETAQIPCWIFNRPGEDDAGVWWARDHAEAAARACKEAAATGTTLLLTIGTRGLAPYVMEARRLGVRLLARVLPEAESTAACHTLGLSETEILGARGPFSIEENRRLIRDRRVGIVVSKDSGSAGGVPEKRAAALAEGIPLLLVARPREQEVGGAVYHTIPALLTALRTAQQ